MNILCVSDLIDPLVYSNSIKERFSQVDLVLSAGDLPLEYLDFIVSSLNKPLLFVYGNHHAETRQRGAAKVQCGALHIGGSVKAENGLLIAGLGGCMRYNRGENQFSETQMYFRIFKLLPQLLFNRIFKGRYCDILLTHAAPRGIHDQSDLCHVGFRSFLWFMRMFRPRYLLHGHIHLYDISALRQTKYMETMVINVYSHYMIHNDAALQAEHHFNRARNKAVLSKIAHFMHADSDRLLSFTDVKNILRPQSEVYRGMQIVPISRIIGSEGRYQDFNKRFLPYKEHLRARWQRVDKAAIEEIILPPIQLYEIGGSYFVRDGNHRVSVALTQGMENIDAEVTMLSSEVNIEPGMTVTELKEALIRYEKKVFYEKTDFLALTGADNLDFTEPGRYDVVYNHILVHKYYLNESQTEELTFGAALLSWYKNVYQPIISIIQDEWLGMNFPGNSPGDLYVWIVTHWDALKEKNGINFPLSAAARDFAATYGKKRGWFFRFLITRIRGLFHKK